jgi:hypothetical protein
MSSVVLEFVPPNVEDGPSRAIEEAQRIRELSCEFGLESMINHLMIPGMIEEDGDRPVAMKSKMDPLDTWQAASPHLPGMRGICTQVTAFLNAENLKQRFLHLQGAGIERIIFVGVPRTMADGEGSGVAPTDALTHFQQQVSHRGVILIPTREGEVGRFNFKCERGATFALTQLLYSDAIVGFLKTFASHCTHRPEILLSFGFVPQVEQKIGLIRWLIQDHGNEAVKKEQAFVSRLTQMKLKEKQQHLLDLYKSVIEGVGALGFPMSIHLEAPYGFSQPAFETFAMMLDYWTPGRK